MRSVDLQHHQLYLTAQAEVDDSVFAFDGGDHREREVRIVHPSAFRVHTQSIGKLIGGVDVTTAALRADAPWLAPHEAHEVCVVNMKVDHRAA